MNQSPASESTDTSKSYDLIAACAFGLEAIVKRELLALGIESKIGESGRVHFSGDAETVALTNLWLRTADRILIRVAEFPAVDFDALFDTTKSIQWGRLLPQDAAFPVTGRSIKSTLSSVPACQRAVKRSIVDAMRRDHDCEDLSETGALYKIDVALLKDVATLTIDTTGRSLHRRGYRTDISKAPLKETLAASMVLLSFWRRDRPLLDPFCGSGTIPIEAAMIGRNIAPGLHRSFAFEDWATLSNGATFEDGAAFSPDILLRLRQDAIAQQGPPLEQRVLGTDIDSHILTAARANAERAGVSDDVHFEPGDARESTSKRRFGCLISNPPYGMRLGRDYEIEALYQDIPHVLRHLPTWSFYFLTAFENFEGTLGRKADRRRKLYNGRIECTYYQYHGPKPVTNHQQTTLPKEASSDKDNAPQHSTRSVDQAPVELQQPASDVQSADERPAAKPYVHAAGEAAFGHLSGKASEQAELFASRLRKRAKHLRRYPTKRGITCFRLYEKDIPEIPLVVDQYEDHLHLSEFERPHDRDLASHANWLDLMAETAGKTLDIPRENVHLKQRSRQRGKTQHEKIADSGHRMVVNEGGLKFWVNLRDYIDTGLFLDHRNTRKMVRDEVEGKHFLNLFAYTGSFSTYAAAGKAVSTTSVDLSQTYLDWARENLELNELDNPSHQFIAMDIREFVRRHRKEESYDVVVCDPPTFSNSKRTDEDWNVQTDAPELIQNLFPLLKPGGVIYFSTNFRRFKFDTDSIPAASVHEISKQTVPDDFRNRRIHRCWRIVK